jgi:hypothetical protein
MQNVLTIPLTMLESIGNTGDSDTFIAILTTLIVSLLLANIPGLNHQSYLNKCKNKVEEAIRQHRCDKLNDESPFSRHVAPSINQRLRDATKCSQSRQEISTMCAHMLRFNSLSTVDMAYWSLSK